MAYLLVALLLTQWDVGVRLELVALLLVIAALRRSCRAAQVAVDALAAGAVLRRLESAHFKVCWAVQKVTVDIFSSCSSSLSEPSSSARFFGLLRDGFASTSIASASFGFLSRLEVPASSSMS